MNSRRRQLVGAGAALLLAPAMMPLRAAMRPGAAPVRIAVADNDTVGAVNSYNTFVQALERRFGGTGTHFEVAFFPIAMTDVPGQQASMTKTVLPFKPDVIFASNSGIALAGLELKTGKPIIFYSNADPVDAGLTDSLTRPNKGMTGFTLGRRAAIKRREMLLRLSPGCRVMGLLSGLGDEDGKEGRAKVGLDVFPGLEERLFSCSTLAELEAALNRPAARAVDGWDIEYTFVPYRYAEETVALFNRTRKPVIYPRMKHVHMGGMAAYVPKIEESDDVWVSQLALLLAGVPIENIPVVQASRYSFGLNLKACHRLGISPSKALIKIADVVVE